MIYLYSAQDSEQYRQLLQQALPQQQVCCWPQPVDAEQVRYAVVWNPPAGFFRGMVNLQAVFVLGAGVDRILQRDDLDPAIPVVRLSDAGMAQQMLEYVLYGVLHVQRRMDQYQRQQQHRQWQVVAATAADKTRIGVLGLGEIGGKVAQGLAAMGYEVAGWSRQGRQLPGVTDFVGEQGLPALLARSDILVNLLPATAETRGLLDNQLLRQLPRGAALINAGRGEQVDEAALLGMLDSGHLRFALLDVFVVEPLESVHPLWSHPAVLLTPHIAAMTLAEPAVAQIVANLQALQQGLLPQGLVSRTRGY
ncbi:2-hydroxyacid dehydrogenase [Aquitalea aquatica]|uniref:Glyoxylate/hydroxypyruvate reductase A n=1 Tax=Aquitalea aquatica TaxID=3044273 RepID=A0A838Y0J9_9NEIS|nr:glyoxylate/hydroxypyruvate reductase A [Aquitalea magnusonii]MBA4708970.1 glyoxylate/hydroxypyruvate reductase A [Aquitalea magnusonii]